MPGYQNKKKKYRKSGSGIARTERQNRKYVPAYKKHKADYKPSRVNHKPTTVKRRDNLPAKKILPAFNLKSKERKHGIEARKTATAKE